MALWSYEKFMDFEFCKCMCAFFPVSSSNLPWTSKFSFCLVADWDFSAGKWYDVWSSSECRWKGIQFHLECINPLNKSLNYLDNRGTNSGDPPIIYHQFPFPILKSKSTVQVWFCQKFRTLPGLYRWNFIKTVMDCSWSLTTVYRMPIASKFCQISLFLYRFRTGQDSWPLLARKEIIK
jgi:hypothetical protein